MFNKSVFMFLVTLLLIYGTSCNTNSTDSTSGTSSTQSSQEASATQEEDPYYMMHIAFEGMPEIEEFKPMLDDVMERYGFLNDRENLLKVGNVLVSLRKDSKVGVTEFEILKHIYQHGSSQVTFPEQAGLSATILEKTK